MKTRNALDGEIKVIRRGLAIYKVRLSPFWRARVWIPSEARYLVRSTRERSRIEAIKAAEELAGNLATTGKLDGVPKSRTFEFYADKLVLAQRALAKHGHRHPLLARNDEYAIYNKSWGLLAYFGRRDVASIRTRDVNEYVAWMTNDRDEPLAFSTVNSRVSCLRKILKLARDDGLIGEVPSTPRPPKNDNPRAFFRFAPLVPKSRDQYQLLLETAKRLSTDGTMVRGVPMSGELYDFILMMMHSFLRPTESEIYALRHRDVAIATNPKRLILTIRKGKTGHRVTNTLEACVPVYQRMKRRYPNSGSNDYVVLPQYTNRSTAKRIIQRQFNYVLEVCRLKQDVNANQPHTVYSLRHTAICMRIIKSEGKVNILNLAKTAGTSVEQIERFYARNLPMNAEMARNLQTFGAKQ